MTEKYIAKSSAIASRMLGGEMMIMSALDSTFFTLNPAATVVWQAADGRTALSEIVRNHVCRAFEVDIEIAQRDVEHFVAELSQHGILLVSDRPFPKPSASPTEAA
ncbi:MAG: PqqD family protein [Terriglobales bacterium]|jgi:hypothetical protein|nr:PqqD family protein [Terriglobales bacterium]